MYIVKNALKCIGRSKARNVLIGVIVLAIAVSACIGLSIQQAAENAKETTLDDMSVTATISFDRQSIMSQIRDQMMNGGEGGFDRTEFSEMMGAASSLSLEEYQTYAAAESVKEFRYTLSASLNGSDAFVPVSNDADTDADSSADASADTDVEEDQSGFGGFGGFGGGMMGGPGGMMGQLMGAQSDFSVVGYSSESAMTSFGADGTASMVEGAVFDTESAALECIISQELATFNDVAVGDTITLTNPNNEEETYAFLVVGIYTDTAANQDSFSIMGSTATDPVNKIHMSYAALNAVIAASEESSVTQTDENTGMEYSSTLNGSLEGTYVFANVDDYYRFEEDVRTLGLSDSYTVSSPDLVSYENRLVPLNTLSKMAGYFLIVILIIGAIVLVVLNLFNVRERKYEIGVLTAMGMKKGKVALQFLIEIFVVTLIAVMLGAGIGAVTSVPVANALLENQVASQTSRYEQTEQNFGRWDPDNEEGGGGRPNMQGGMSFGGFFGGFFGGNAEVDYITEIQAAVNFTVVLQLLGIAVLLTLVSGTVSMLVVMRYDPLRILANRD